jgi:hypothetical protein
LIAKIGLIKAKKTKFYSFTSTDKLFLDCRSHVY